MGCDNQGRMQLEQRALEIERLKEAERLLRKYQWAGRRGVDHDPACPCCGAAGRYDDDPDCGEKHDDACAWAAWLKGAGSVNG